MFHVKHMFCLSLALVLALALAAPAFADVMWEPTDNPFYEKHRGECRYENRGYYANGKDGFVTLLDAPGGSMVRTQYENGTVLWVGYIYGGDWALIERWEDNKDFSGWVPMSELELVYDFICFEEEYADRIKDYNGEFANYAGGAEVIHFYEYPGAPEIDQSFEVSNSWGGDILGNLTGTSENSSYIHKIFVDEDGRTWGFINYMYGYRNAWFCLDEPDGTDFPVRDVSAPSLTPAQTPVLPAAGYVPYALVAAVVAGTGGLLAFFYGKKRKKPTE